MPFKPNPLARQQIHGAVFAGVQETFELDIKPQAQRNSPVRTGTNRRSIDVEVVEVPNGVRASIFTQSGYGGFLEIGTRFMAAQPHLYPAFNKFRRTLLARVRAAMQLRRGKK